MRVIILCLLFLIPTAIAADKGIFYILDEKFIDNISELPDSNPIAEINIQKSGGYLAGWVDITGYRDMSRENNINYVPGNPAEYAIVLSEAGLFDGKRLMTPSEASGSDRKFDSITKSISVEQNGNITVAKLHAVLKYHTMCRDYSGSYICSRGTEEKDFYDSEPSPEIYPPLQNISVNLTQYNNSLYENIGIRIVNISGLNKYTIQYEDNIATYRLKKAHVEQTAKGIYFANVTPAEFLDLKGKNISRYGETILLNGNLSKMSPDSISIKITGSNLYEAKTANSGDFNITRLEFKPETELENPVMMWFMSVMAVMVGGIYFYARRMSALW
jgi:hypothetical protein